MDYDKELLVTALRKVLLRGTFKLASGQTSDYYIDGRLVTLSAAGAPLAGAGVLQHLYQGVAAIGGLTIGADPIVGAVLALAGSQGRNDLQGFLVRKEAKEHGTGKLIEGPLSMNMPVAIVDDVVTTGGSLFQAIEAVERFGCRVVQVIVMLDRLQGAEQAFADRGIRFTALTTIRDLGL